MTTRTTLLALLLSTFLAPAAAQVGVNNPDPEQALDVNGKVKVGDDRTPPTDGTMRYNETDGIFEGYTNGKWETLNTKSAAPEMPVPVTMTMFQTAPIGINNPQATDYEPIDYVTTHFNTSVVFDLNAENERKVVPDGYYLVIDRMTATSAETTGDATFLVEFIAGDGTAAQTLANPRMMLSGSNTGGTVSYGNGRGPIMVLEAGKQLLFVNRSDSSTGPDVRAVVTGFLVRSVDDYFTY